MWPKTEPTSSLDPEERELSYGWFLALLGWGTLFWVHSFRLRTVPGLHFDEAWALNHAYRWIDGQGTWQAMSPYTTSWVHGLAALWMKLFGEGLLSFRLSHTAMVFLGLWLTSRAIGLHFGKLSAQLFPWFVLLLPGMALNHRFAIELNSIHILCLGVVLFAFSKKILPLAAFALVVGVTSHVLFLALPLALLFSYMLKNPRPHSNIRWWNTFLALLLLAFSAHIFLSVPEKGKAALLILLCMGILLVHWWSLLWDLFFRFRKPLEVLVALVALPFCFNALFFSGGLWSLATQKGWPLFQSYYGLWLLCFIPLLLPIFYGCKRLSSEQRIFALTLLAALGALMLKPAPRYFALAMVILAVLGAVGSVRLWQIRRGPILCFGIFLLGGFHSWAVYQPYLNRNPRDGAVRFLWFKDESRDFLPKQKVADFLSGSQCGPSAISEMDSRIAEAVVALRRADWPVQSDGRCPFPPLRLLRASEGAGVPVPGSGLKLWAAQMDETPMRNREKGRSHE
jgi:hypothetical protein